MRPRTELALGATLLVLLGAAAAALGSRNARTGDSDARRSTFLFGPSGASAFSGALSRLGVRVEQFRRPIGSLDPGLAGPHVLIAFLGPTEDLTPTEGVRIARLPADLLLAGPAAGAAMRCLGYDVVRWRGDSVAVRRPAGSDSLPMPMVRWLLRGRSTPTMVDSSDVSDGLPVTCTSPPTVGVDTLLRAAGRPVAVRLSLQAGRTAVLVSDDRLFSNAVVRESAAGSFVLGLVVPRYRRVVVDEFHHGFDASRSMAGATLEWSLHSPWGWAVWQLAMVGVIALLAAGVRFGPVQGGIERWRRSPLEHVRALATALAAARGHDVAIRLIVQGLRRRLAGAGRPARGGTAEWLESLTPAVHTPRGQEALGRLTTVSHRSAGAEEVLVAAHDVETLWEELKPS